jgi:hypothetical protein
MKRQLIAGLAAGLLGVSGLVAAQQQGDQSQGSQYQGSQYQGQMLQGWQDYPGQTWQQKMCKSGRFTLAGEYFYRNIKEKQPYSLTNHMDFFVPVGLVEIAADAFQVGYAELELDQTVLQSWSVKGHGNFGAVFTAYQYRNNDEPYFALRARWSSGSVHKKHHHDGTSAVGPYVFNDLLDYVETATFSPTFEVFFNPEQGPSQFIPTQFVWGDQAHEWNVEARLGYTFGGGCCNEFGLTPYLGVGYEGGRMNLVGRQEYWWWYIPVGFVASWQFNPNFSMALDAEFGMMAGARYVQFDEPSINNIHRQFDNKYRWELELPLNWQFPCWGRGNFSLGLVPFWHGWRTWEKLQGEMTVHRNVSGNGFESIAQFAVLQDPDGVITGQSFDFPNTTFFNNLVETYDQPVATPRMLNNSWGGRLEFGWTF